MDFISYITNIKQTRKQISKFCSAISYNFVNSEGLVIIHKKNCWLLNRAIHGNLLSFGKI